MNTFTQLKEVIGDKSLNITMSVAGETMSVMATIGSHTPVIISGTSEEIDEHFIDALKEKSTAIFSAEVAEVEEPPKTEPKKAEKPKKSGKDKGKDKLPADTETICTCGEAGKSEEHHPNCPLHTKQMEQEETLKEEAKETFKNELF